MIRYEHLLERKAAMPDGKDHLLIGAQPDSEEPILLHRSVLEEHLYILGRTGSGKTSRAIMPIVSQLLDGDEKSPIVIFDLKGDLALFNTVRMIAAERGREFRQFSVRPGVRSDYFDPFQNLEDLRESPSDLGELLIQSLSLYHGDGYGRSYFSRQHRNLMVDVLTRCASAPPLTWQSLIDGFLTKQPHRRRRDNQELIAAIEPLANFTCLQSPHAETHENVIHMPTVLERRQVVYFWLHSRTIPMSARDIGKLALFCLLHATGEAAEKGEKVQAYAFIDEFQRLAAANIAQILQAARAYGLSLTLAHQVADDLRTPDADLRATVLGNTRSKLIFSAITPDEIRYIEQVSGEKEEQQASRGRTFGRDHAVSTNPTAERGGESRSATRGWRSVWRPHLTKNDIIAVSAHPDRAFLFVAGDAGHTQLHGRPAVIDTLHCMTAENYRQRLSQRWQAATEVTSVPPEVDSEYDAAVALSRERHRAQLKDMAAYLQRKESFEEEPPVSRDDN